MARRNKGPEQPFGDFISPGQLERNLPEQKFSGIKTVEAINRANDVGSFSNSQEMDAGVMDVEDEIPATAIDESALDAPEPVAFLAEKARVTVNEKNDTERGTSRSFSENAGVMDMEDESEAKQASRELYASREIREPRLEYQSGIEIKLNETLIAEDKASKSWFGAAARGARKMADSASGLWKEITRQGQDPEFKAESLTKMGAKAAKEILVDTPMDMLFGKKKFKVEVEDGVWVNNDDQSLFGALLHEGAAIKNDVSAAIRKFANREKAEAWYENPEADDKAAAAAEAEAILHELALAEGKKSGTRTMAYEAKAGLKNMLDFHLGGLADLGSSYANMFVMMADKFRGSAENAPGELEEQAAIAGAERAEVAGAELETNFQEAKVAKTEFGNTVVAARENYVAAIDKAEKELARNVRLIAKDKTGGFGVEFLKAKKGQLERQVDVLRAAQKSAEDKITRETYKTLLAEAEEKLTQRSKLLMNPDLIKGKARDMIKAEMRELETNMDTYESIVSAMDKLDNLTPDVRKESAAA